MCVTIRHGVTCALNSIKSATITGAKAAFAGYQWAGRKVEKYTECLPPTVAKIITSTVWSIPYTVGALIAPTILSDISSGMMMGLWQINGHAMDEKLGMDHRQHIFRGFRNANIIRVGIDALQMYTTSNWFLLAPALFRVLFILQCNLIAKQPTPPPKQPEPAPAPA